MRKKLRFGFSIILIFLIDVYSYGQMFGQEPTERIRTYDVQHILIDIQLDLKAKTVKGRTVTTIVPLNNSFKRFEVDAVGMELKGVKIQNNSVGQKQKKLTYKYDKSKLTVNLEREYSAFDTITYIVEYSTTDPEKGLYFIGPTATFPKKPYQVWSQGEGEDNRYWFPCYDYPNDMATSEMYVTVDNNYRTISNCILESKKDNTNGTTTWHWVSSIPYSSYLVMLAAGNWDFVEDSWDGIPVISYVPVGKKEWGKRSYRHSADILKFFSEYTGFRYPWGGYSQVAVEDFIYGGMENTGAVVYFDGSVYDEMTEPDYNATNLVAHEIAHQWWGDVVTCRNWSEIWLNESFATYFQMLYTEYLLGKDEFDYNVFRNGNDAIKVDSTTARKPIYIRSGLTTNTYDKGSVVLNMLRYLLGDDMFWKSMNIYITKNQFKPVVTKNLLDAVHAALDDPLKDQMPPNLSWFFEEWIYKAGQPEFKVSYNYDESAKELSLTAQQVQRMDSSSVFKIPVPVQILSSSGKIDVSMQTSDVTKTYKIKLDSKPLCVIFNKGNKTLSKLYFTKPEEDWLYQLKNSEDAIERITAIRGLKDFINDDNVVSELTVVMNNDKFWGARYEAAQMLSNSKNKIVQDVYLKNLTEEKDSRVRRSYITGIGNLYDNNPELKESKAVLEFFMINLINNETSYYAIADGINTLEKIMDKDKIYEAVVPYLSRDSHVEIIRRSVIAALDSSNDARAVDIFLEYGEKGATSRLRNAAIHGLGSFLDNPKVIEFLNKKVLEKTRSTQGVILSLLEKAKNPSSRVFLEELSAKSNDEGFKKQVSEVLQKLN